MLLSILALLLNFNYCLTYTEQWYTVRFDDNAADWVDLLTHESAIYSSPLSSNALSYARRPFKFKFPFYEEAVEQMQVTTTGFLTTGTPNVANVESRYIAPLMAPFAVNDVRHFSDSKVFINQWTELPLEDQTEVGGFTFQVQLHCDGVIKFIYLEVPIPVGDINTSSHPVRVGLCDSYEREAGLVPYDRLELEMSAVRSNTTFTLTPNRSCGSMKSCSACLQHAEGCVWCSEIQRCSTREGLDRYHRMWTLNGCPADASRVCPVPDPSQMTETPAPPAYDQCNSSSTSPSPIDPAESTAVTSLGPHFQDKMVDPDDPSDPSVSTSSSSSSSFILIIITIGICSLCVSTILVISALLIRKFGKRSALGGKGPGCSESLLATPGSGVVPRTVQPEENNV